MKKLVAGAAALVAAVGLWSCGLLKHDVNINLNPDLTFTIKSNPPSTDGRTENPLTIDPSIAGKDYTDNKSKIDSATLKSLTFDIVLLYPDNRATKLLNGASVTLTNLRTSERQSFTVNEIAIAPGASNTLTVFSPPPNNFLTTILKNADRFTAEASGTIDNSPVHIDVKVSFKVTLSVNLL